MTLSYQIRLEWDKDQNLPAERVFDAMSYFTKGFNTLNSAMIKCYDSHIVVNSVIDKTHQGSLITDIKHFLDKVSANLNVLNVFDAIFSGLEAAISNVGNIESEQDIDNFIDNVYKLGGEKASENNSSIIHHDQADKKEIAKALKLIADGMSLLSETDVAEIGRDRNFKSIDKAIRFNGSVDSLFRKEIKDYPAKVTLEIAKPDYSGKSKWEFSGVKGRNKTFYAKMSDVDWLEKWYSHEHQIWPGDALFVELKSKQTKANRGKAHTLTEHEIIKVIRIIPKTEFEQQKMEIGHE